MDLEVLQDKDRWEAYDKLEKEGWDDPWFKKTKYFPT